MQGGRRGRFKTLHALFATPYESHWLFTKDCIKNSNYSVARTSEYEDKASYCLGSQVVGWHEALFTHIPWLSFLISVLSLHKVTSQNRALNKQIKPAN